LTNQSLFKVRKVQSWPKFKLAHTHTQHTSQNVIIKKVHRHVTVTVTFYFLSFILFYTHTHTHINAVPATLATDNTRQLKPKAKSRWLIDINNKQTNTNKHLNLSKPQTENPHAHTPKAKSRWLIIDKQTQTSCLCLLS